MRLNSDVKKWSFSFYRESLINNYYRTAEAAEANGSNRSQIDIGGVAQDSANVADAQAISDRLTANIDSYLASNPDGGRSSMAGDEVQSNRSET